MLPQRRISASSFRSLLLCPHSLFLDHHGDPSLKTELSEFENYLMDEGKRFEKEVLQDQIYVCPDYPEGDLDAGAEATLKLMTAGEALIYQGVLMTDRFIGVPDLLVKRPGTSSLGAWYYEPCEIKTAKSVKDAHTFQLCLYALMLEQIQRRRPSRASVILADKNEVVVDLEEVWPHFEKRLAQATAIIEQRTTTDLAIFSGCKECPWQQACYDLAIQREDVSLVAGLRRNLKPQFLEAGIRSVSDLAATSADVIAGFRGVGDKTARKLVVQAKAQQSGQLIALAMPQLPRSPIELYYDIEGEPNLDVDYLHGLLIVERGKEDRYLSFVAESPSDEQQAFGDLLRFVKDVLDCHPRTPIYHYHHYERTHVTVLFEKYPEQVMSADDLLDRFVDLHKALTEAFVLPVEGYGLKPVSKWLGFMYRNTRSNAVQSMLWYRLWLDTGNRQFLDDSLLYNEDDCRATKLIKEWLGTKES